MPSLDLGGLFARADIITEPFDRKYSILIRRFASLGEEAGASSRGISTMDRAFAGAAGAADKLAASQARATQSTTREATAAERAATAQRAHAAAAASVNETMARYAASSTKVQQLALREVAAERRLAASYEQAGSAAAMQARETARLASQQATAIGATQRMAAAERDAAVAGGRMHEGMGGNLKMLRDLGLAFGAFEAVKKVIDISKEANTFDASMTRIQTVVGASKAEVNSLRGSVLSLAGETAQAPDELAKSIYHMEAIGLRGAKALDATRIAAEGATIGNADLEDTTNALTSTIASGITKNQSFKDTMAQILTIVGTGDMKLQDFNESLSSGLLTIMGTYGVTLKDVGAAMATFGDNNIRGANAATMLRIAVQSIASPGVGPRSQAALEKLGITATQLKKDLQTGGLNKAISDLRTHIHAAGISSKEAGALITDAFTKRGAQGINVLLSQYDRLQTKYGELDKNSANFGKRWDEASRTAKFALASFGHELEATGIELVGKTGPAVASVTRWLTGAFRSALSLAGDAVHPFISAWQTLQPSLTAVGHGLAAVGRYLAPLAPVLKTVGAAALTMYGAFKGLSLIRSGLSALSGAIGNTAARAGTGLRNMAAAAASANLRLQTMSIGGLAARGALAGIGIALTVGAIAWQKHSEAVAAAKARIDGYTQAIQQDSGAIGDNTRKAVENNLMQEGMYQKALKYGISQKTLTDAAMGNAAAQRKVGDAINAVPYGLRTLDLELFRRAIIGTNNELNAAKQNTNDLAAADGKAGTKMDWFRMISVEAEKAVGKASTAMLQGAQAAKQHAAAVAKSAKVTQYNIDAHGNLVRTMEKAGSALDNTTAAMDRQTQASNILKNAIDYLNGVNVTVEQTTDQLNIALGQLANKSSLAKGAHDHLSRSLDQSTVAGAQNRQMLLGVIQNAKDAAQAVADHARQQGASLPAALAKGNLALAQNENKIRAAAQAAGLDKGQVNDLIASVGKLAKLPPTAPKVSLDTRAAHSALSGLMSGIANANPKMTLNLALSTAGRALLNSLSSNALVGGITAGIHRAGGGRVRGPGTATSDSIPARLSNGEFVVNAAATSRHLGLLQAINSGVRGFAKGGVAGAQSWLHAQNPKRYDFGAAGPNSWDCSGLVGGALLKLLGQSPNHRIFSTNNEGSVLSSYGFKRGAGGPNSLMVVGWNGHHTTGSVGGLKFEAYGDEGVPLKDQIRVGGNARSPSSFPNVMHLPNGAKGIKAQPGGNPPMSGGVGKITTRSVDGKKKFVYGGQIYASRAAALNAQTRAGASAAKDAAEKEKQRQDSMRQTVSGSIGGIGAAAASPQVDVSSTGINRIRAQIAHARQVLSVEANKGLSKSAVKTLRSQIDALAASANKQLSALRLKIKGSDVKAVTASLKGSASDVSAGFSQMYTDAAHAGASRNALTLISGMRTRLLGAQSKTAKAQARLSSMTDYRSGIISTLGEGFDPTKYGSAADMLTGLTSATGQNQTYSSQLGSLRNRVKGNAALTSLVDTLAASGNSAGLASLFGASKNDLAKLGKAYGGYSSSLTGAGNAAVALKYNQTYSSQQAAVKTAQDAQAALITTLTNYTAVLGRIGAPTLAVNVDGKRVSESVVSNTTFEHYIAGMIRNLGTPHKYGHKPHR